MSGVAEVVGWTVIAIVGLLALFAGMVAWAKVVERFADRHAWPSSVYAVMAVSPLIIAVALTIAFAMVAAPVDPS